MRPAEVFGSVRRAITRRTAIAWLLLGALLYVWIAYLRHLAHLVATIHALLVRGSVLDAAKLKSDFLVFWPAGHIAATSDAARIYDPAWFAQWSAAHLGPGLPAYLHYFYPPPALLLPLLSAPFGFGTGLLFWTLLISLPGLVVLRKAGAPWPVIAAGTLSGASLYGIVIGEFGPLSGAIFIAGLFAIGQRPVKSGVLLGLLSLKPQGGLLGPIALLARGEIGALAVGAGVVAALCAAITLIAGPAIWSGFLNHGMAAAHAHLVARFPADYENSGISVFWMMRSLRLSVAAAWVAQIIAALLAGVWCWRAWRRPNPDRVALVALTVCLTLLATPYGYVNDMSGFSIMIAWLAWQRGRLEPMAGFLWLWPILSPVVADALHVELAPLVVLLGALRAARALDGIGTQAAACYPAPS